jgi:hypothetical protein
MIPQIFVKTARAQWKKRYIEELLLLDTNQLVKKTAQVIKELDFDKTRWKEKTILQVLKYRLQNIPPATELSCAGCTFYNACSVRLQNQNYRCRDYEQYD